MPTYDRIDQTTRTMLNQVMRQYHAGLEAAGVHIAALFAYAPKDQNGDPKSDALKVGGYAAFATVRILPLKQRVLIDRDALVMIDGDKWPRLPDQVRRSIVDHELTHLQVKWAEPPTEDEGGKLTGGVPETDDWHRPKLEMRLHDWQLGGFHEVAERWQKQSVEVETIRLTIDKHGQYLLPYIDGVERSIGEASAKGGDA